MKLSLKNSNLLRLGSYINGQWLTNPSRFKVEDPATKNPIAEVSEVQLAQVEAAIEAAFAAQKTWQQQTSDEKASLLKQWNELILANQEDLARIMTLEQGKPLAESRNEIIYGAKYLEWYAEEARRVNGTVLPVNKAGRRALVLKRPVGVVAAITPWNFPNAMILRKAAAALAAGCSVVVKPSELTPLSALALAALAQQAGFPPGLFNLVVGSDAQAIGEVLTTHPKVAKFSFTGSTQVGQKLLQQCSTTVKNTSMELGGNAPFIGFADADLELLVKSAMASKFRNSGQTCVCANRFLIHEDLLDSFVEQLAEKVSQLKTGSGDQPNVTIGPLINQKAVDKLTFLVQDAVEKGAELVCGGAPISQAEGYFYAPTIIKNVREDMAIFNSEIFGPVASIMSFSSEEQAVRLANQTEYGLCSYVFTQDLNRIWRLSEALEFGMVGINEGVLSNAAAPFGGIKASGMGREGGQWGIEEYLETRYVCMGNLD